MTNLTVIGHAGKDSIRVRFYLDSNQIGDGFVDLEQWDRMRNDLNAILEEDNPVWVVNTAEYEQTTGETL